MDADRRGLLPENSKERNALLPKANSIEFPKDEAYATITVLGATKTAWSRALQFLFELKANTNLAEQVPAASSA
jgi:hypothetical protein